MPRKHSTATESSAEEPPFEQDNDDEVVSRKKSEKKSHKKPNNAGVLKTIGKEIEYFKRHIRALNKLAERDQKHVEELQARMDSLTSTQSVKQKNSKPKPVIDRSFLKPAFVDTFCTKDRKEFDQKELTLITEREAFEGEVFSYSNPSVFGVTDHEMKLHEASNDNNKITRADIGNITMRLYQIEPIMKFSVKDREHIIDIKKWAELPMKEFSEKLNKCHLIAPKGKLYKIRGPFAEALVNTFPRVVFEDENCLTEATLHGLFKKYSILKPLYSEILNLDVAKSLDLEMIELDGRSWMNTNYMNKFFKGTASYKIEEDEYKPAQIKKLITSAPEDSEELSDEDTS